MTALLKLSDEPPNDQKSQTRRKPLFRQSTTCISKNQGHKHDQDCNNPLVPDQKPIPEAAESIDVEDIDHQDIDTIDIYLRDSLIKSFMVIFTNSKSQHLLLNKDLIEIALNCLEYCNESSPEAKLHLAKLISIISKFPTVQERYL